ncbi:MAG: TCP-1/cpn60 chaperonin family protein [Bacillota bacterium]|nr:TCP-1/cpn60 chaperonin family protein [Bacillota bacterium]
MSDKPITNNEVDDKFQTLLSNAAAARVISQTIEGTIGPRGLDIMMVDRTGDVVISNDGVTILRLMEVNHPVARMIINAARSQQVEVGDGTTTSTIWAGSLVAEGANQVLKGVPVTQVIQGIKTGVEAAVELIEEHSLAIHSMEDKLLFDVACIAGRGEQDLAGLVIQGASLLGKEKLLNPDYRFADAVIAREGVENQVLEGIFINKVPMNKEMPRVMDNCKILLIDDALAPDEVDREARGTEAGFKYYIQNKEKFENKLRAICQMGVNVILTDRSIDDLAEQRLTDAGIVAIQRVPMKEMDKIALYTDARKIKRAGLNRESEVIAGCLGNAQRLEVNDKNGYSQILGGIGEPHATILIGAATEEVVDERERIAFDAASAVQAALKNGVVPGGGAIEIWVANQLEQIARDVKGMAAYGVICVKEALLRPFSCIASNAGFNPLEKLSAITAEQMRQEKDSIAMNCDDGTLCDSVEKGVVDPVLVKIHALKAASEVATAILKINTIVKMKEVNAAGMNAMNILE